MSKISIKVFAAALIAALAFAGCGGGGGGSTSTKEGTLGTDVVLSGIVKDSRNMGVKDVAVYFGSPAKVAITDRNGNFQLKLNTTNILSLFPFSKYPNGATFGLDVTSAGGYPNPYQMWKATYNGQKYSKQYIPVPTEVLTGATRNLGTITLLYKPINEDEPPPIPDEDVNSDYDPTPIGSVTPPDGGGGGGINPPPPPGG